MFRRSCRWTCESKAFQVPGSGFQVPGSGFQVPDFGRAGQRCLKSYFLTLPSSFFLLSSVSYLLATARLVNLTRPDVACRRCGVSHSGMKKRLAFWLGLAVLLLAATVVVGLSQVTPF